MPMTGTPNVCVTSWARRTRRSVISISSTVAMPSSVPRKTPISAFSNELRRRGSAGSIAGFSTETLVWFDWLSSEV